MRVKAAAYLLLLCALAPLSVFIYRAADNPGATWGWDQSSHARNGLRLTQGITQLDPAAFFGELFWPFKYPPVHSVLQVPFYVALGPGHAAPRIPSILAAMVTAVLLLALAIRLGADPIAAAVSIAAAFWTAPHTLCMAAVPMLEVFGGLGLVLVAICTARAIEDPARTRWVALSLALLYLTTTNWFVIAATALVLHVVLHHGWRTCRDRVREFLDGYRPHAGLPLVCNLAAALSLAVALWVQLTGGVKVGKMSLTTPLGPLTVALYLVAAQAVAVFWKRREKIRAWPVAARAWLQWCAIPIFVWLFLVHPTRVRRTIDFMFGSETALPFAERFLYYPRAWFGDYHASIVVGFLALLGAVILAARWKKLPLAGRFVVVLLAVAVAALTAHRGKELRFGTGVLPLFWLAAAVIPARRWVSLAVALLVAGVSVMPAMTLHRGPLALRTTQQHMHPGMQPAATFAADACAEAKQSFRIVGIFDGLTDHVIESEIRARRTMRDLRWDCDFPAHTEEQGRVWFEKWKESKHAEEVVVMIIPSAERMRLLTTMFVKAPHLQKLDGWLAATPRYRLDREADFPAQGVRIRVWKRTD